MNRALIIQIKQDREKPHMTRIFKNVERMEGRHFLKNYLNTEKKNKNILDGEDCIMLKWMMEHSGVSY